MTLPLPSISCVVRDDHDTLAARRARFPTDEELLRHIVEGRSDGAFRFLRLAARPRTRAGSLRLRWAWPSCAYSSWLSWWSSLSRPQNSVIGHSTDWPGRSKHNPSRSSQEPIAALHAPPALQGRVDVVRYSGHEAHPSAMGGQRLVASRAADKLT